MKLNVVALLIPEEISLAVDDRVYATIVPPVEGFASLGSFLNINTNIWKSGSKLAPFDKEVKIIKIKVYYVVVCKFPYIPRRF